MPSKHFAMDTGSEAGMTSFSCLLNRYVSSILAIQIAPPNITNLDNFIPDSSGLVGRNDRLNCSQLRAAMPSGYCSLRALVLMHH